MPAFKSHQSAALLYLRLRRPCLASQGDKIECLVIDAGLGETAVGGIKAAGRIAKRLREIPVLYTSGSSITDGMRALIAAKAVNRNAHVPRTKE